MTKNGQKMQFQCNQRLLRVRGIFLAKGYRGYTDLLNFPQWILLLDFCLIFCFSILQSLCISMFLCNFNCLAQAQTGLHWNFFLCNLKAKNQRYPKPSNGYTGIRALCNLLSIKKQIK
jgi:hypothetical protein